MGIPGLGKGETVPVTSPELGERGGNHPSPTRGRGWELAVTPGAKGEGYPGNRPCSPIDWEKGSG